jgi:SnoaL-like protein
MPGDSIAERFIAAFSAADFETMRELLTPDLVAWLTDADGAMQRLDGRDGYLERIEAMDLPAARFSVEPTQVPVRVGERIAEWWMVDAKPAESDALWAG